MATRSPNASRKTRGHRRRERDLRHQHQHAASAAADRGREAQVDLGLAAAGHAVQERDAEVAGGGERAQPLERGVLLRRQLATAPDRRSDADRRRLEPDRDRRRLAAARRRERIAVDAVVPEADVATPREA